MEVISIINEKGGMGKTTISINLAVGLARKDNRVLLIDCDAQGNTTSYFSDMYHKLNIKEFNNLIVPENTTIRKSTSFIKRYIKENDVLKKDINNILLGNKEEIHDCIYHTKYDNVDIIPSFGTELIKTDKMISSSTRLGHKKLKNALREVRKDYDAVVIDNAPTFNNITVNSLFASNRVIIPLRPGLFELDALVNTMNELFDFEDDYEKEYEIQILMNMIPRGNRPDYSNFIKKIHEFYPSHVLTTTIGYQDAVASRSSMETKVIIDSKSKIADDYIQLINEIEGGISHA
ncbi:MAG: AAA family ATPase [Erysipelotrichaceae bacterium]|nr:AAA family ATPase [Erysipelotrichaceae bacterium]